MLRQKQEEAQQEVVRCLDVVTNVVVVWNTAYAQLALQCRRCPSTWRNSPPPVLPT